MKTCRRTSAHLSFIASPRAFTSLNFIAILALLQLAQPIRAGTVGGILTSNTRWTAAESPYVVVEHLTLAEGATLTIDPGVEVRFGQFIGFWVYGTLAAAASPEQPIVFHGTQSNAGWWRGVLLGGSGSARFENCVIADAGYWDSVGVLKTGSGSLELRQSTIRNCAGDGLRLAAGYSSFVSSGSRFLENTRGVRLAPNASFDDASSTFEGNGVDVHVDGGNIDRETVWNVPSAYAISVSGHLTVDTAGRLALAPGVVVKMAQFSGLWVHGILAATGTAAKPIFITESRDDSVGGDANRDGSTSAPAAGFWRGIYIEPAGTAELAHVTLRYSGYWDLLGLRKTGGGLLKISHSVFSDISGRGLLVENNTGLVQLSDSEFRQSASGVQLNNSGPVSAERCLFAGNSNYGVLQQVNDSLAYSSNRFETNAWGSVGMNGGALGRDAAWTRGMGPAFEVVLRDHFTVETGATLAISPGVTVRLAQFVGLHVRGTLAAKGLPGEPIRFLGTSENAGWHRGLLLTDATVVLEHCEMAHGGYWEGASLLKTGSGTLTLKRSTIRDGSGDGLRITGAASFVSESNTFSNHSRGVHLGAGMWFDDPGARFENNGVNILADGGGFDHHVIWNVNKDYAVLVADHLTVGAAGRLIVAPGTVVKMGQFDGLYIKGALELRGTPEQPVFVTDLRDDSVGGDANNDGAESGPSGGWWRGIFVDAGGSASLTNATIRYGGYWEQLQIRKAGPGQMSMQNCVVADGSHRGLLVEDNAGAVSLAGCQFARNGQSGLQLNGAGPVAATGCIFESNGQHGVLQQINDGIAFRDNHFAANAWGSVGINGGTLSKSAVWSRGIGSDFEIVLRDHVTIGSAGSLAVEPGVIVRAAQFTGLWVHGALRAAGTAALPVRFTGTSETPGWWRGILLSEAGSGDLEHAEISHGGYWEGCGLAKSGAGALTLRSARFIGVAGHGLRLNESSGAHLVSGCSFLSNNVGVYVRNVGTQVTLAGSRIFANRDQGVVNENSAEVDARNSWWGSASGPRHPVKNPLGEGNAVSDGVLFQPWLDGLPAEPGSLTVSIEPVEAVAAGAGWSIDSTNWQASGAGLSLQPGEWVVQFKPLAGWIAPPARIAAIISGQSTTLSAAYRQEPSGASAVFEPGPHLNAARMGHNAALLADGRVILLGGHGPGFVSLATAESWRPGSAAFSTLQMRHSHDWPAFAELGDGRLLLAGGSADLGIPQYSEAEVFDPANDSFSSVGGMVRFRSGAGAAALSGGQVLIAGAWWTHNDAHTYGELWNATSGGFGATLALNQLRAYPIVLPTTDNRAVVLGGVGPTGEAIPSNVELYDPVGNNFVVLQPGLFAGEEGWNVMTHQTPIAAQQLGDGRYLLMAYRPQTTGNEHALFTFDPASRSIARFPTQPALPRGDTFALWPPVIDKARNRALILGQAAGLDRTELRVLTVALDSGAIITSSNSHVPEPMYYLGGAAVTLLPDGRLFITGGTEDGSNFRAVRRTLLVTPGGGQPAPALKVSQVAGGRVEVSWPAGYDEWQLQQSANLEGWSAAPEQPVQEGGVLRVSFHPAAGARFFRLVKN